MTSPEAFAALHEFEREHIIEALRRDLRRETRAIFEDIEFVAEHKLNAYRDKNLLEQLAPRTAARYAQRASTFAPPPPADQPLAPPPGEAPRKAA